MECLDRSGGLVNSRGETNQVKDDRGDKHADVELEGSNKLEYTTEGGDDINGNYDASNNTNASLESTRDSIVVDLACERGTETDSNAEEDSPDAIVDNIDNSKDNDCAAVIAAAATCDSSPKEKEKSKHVRCDCIQTRLAIPRIQIPFQNGIDSQKYSCFYLQHLAPCFSPVTSLALATATAVFSAMVDSFSSESE